MNRETQPTIPDENQENDFLDFIVGAVAMGGLLFGIFIVATVVSFFV